MAHLKGYEKNKKIIENRKRVQEKRLSKNRPTEDFIIENSTDYGIVIEVRYNDAFVLYNDKVIMARLRKNSNLICNKVLFPGDRVVIAKENKEYIITNLIKRTNILTRNKKDSTKISESYLIKTIAANIDLAIIVVSAKEPPLHPKFIDRYLIILQNCNIPAIICLNKCELKSEKEDKILTVYKELGIPVIETSTYNKTGIDELKSHLLNKQAILVGNSGVGKSSLTNALMDDDSIKTNEIGNKSKRGRHTTTSSKYYIWNDNSSIIDTPGIRSLDVSSFKPIEIQDFFPEFDDQKDKCKYNNCLHYHEPLDSCYIKQNVAAGLINLNRYESYLRVLSNTLDEEYDENIAKELK